ncbi:MAG: hypothetical protein JO324_01955 [Candidatus Eremiobacteraeota bacterium]|nr:hypothetical protein [Candidatus Eremiobacteraeota bacterium]
MKAARLILWCSIVAMGCAIAACGGAVRPYSATNGLPPIASDATGTTTNPIKHVVIVIQENRSFDNLFATYPGADGTKVGAVAAMPPSIAQSCSPPITQPTTIPLQESHLAGGVDLDHIYNGYKTELDGGKMDGFDLVGQSADGSGPPACTLAYQYVNPAEIKPYWDIAQQYVLADHTFQTQGSSSFTAHQDLIAGGTQITATHAVIDNPTWYPWGCDAPAKVVTAIIKRYTHQVYRYAGPFPCFEYPTLRDLLDAKGVSWKFYAVKVNKPPHGLGPGIWSAFDAIKAVRYSSEWGTNVTRSNLDFFTDIKSRRLPAVSWITPDASDSDHPAEQSDTGPSWVASIVNAVGKSPYWKSTAVVILWDDWGGFYDHAPPPKPYNWQGGPGFRVPMLIVSAYVKPHVDHTMYQFGSVLRLIEKIWGLGSLGNNDQQSQSIGNAFDIKMPARKFRPIESKYPLQFFLHKRPSGLIPDTE